MRVRHLNEGESSPLSISTLHSAVSHRLYFQKCFYFFLSSGFSVMVCCPVVAQMMPSRGDQLPPVLYAYVYSIHHRISVAFSTAASYCQLEWSWLSTAVSLSFSVLSQPTEEEEGGKGIILIQGSLGWMRYCEGVTLRWQYEIRAKLEAWLFTSPKTEVDFMLEENCISHAALSVKGFILPLNCVCMHVCMKLLGKFYYHIE